MSNVKFQRTKRIKLFSNQTDDFQNLKYETLATVDYEYSRISSCAILDRKFWMKEDADLYTDNL